jgi:hypothetical protein
MAKTRKRASAPESLKFTPVNALLGVAGILVLGVGYWLLAQGSITAAPLLLVLGYVVLVPMAIIR